ncbi:MAG TPA: peptidylprolyl isomerase [Saprospiraceae bacterium]|nr:peptidylprolyl isomerase [Saprospiraceae bacterium]
MTIFRLSLFFLLFIYACAGPKSAFEVLPYQSNAPAKVIFVNKSHKATSYFWDFGDGNTSTNVNPEHKFIKSGKHTVTLTAQSNKKVHKFSQEILVTISDECLIEMNTNFGSMTIQLYDETPLHRDNFLKLIESGYYEGTLFHRVIKGFMVQGGDPDSKNAPEGKRLGLGGPAYNIPAEFNDTLVHIKGVLAAARQGDGVNPKKESSGSQFYIVQGKPVSATQLENFELQKGIKYTDKAKMIYQEMGGAPQLDKEYTVFGRVIDGLDIIDTIAEQATDNTDRPLKDVKIISVKVIK